jgi:hypothetical protein
LECRHRRRSIFVFRAAGSSDNGDSRKRSSHDASVWSVRSPEVSPAPIDLREDFPDPPLTRENHNVVLVDDSGHTKWAFPDHSRSVRRGGKVALSKRPRQAQTFPCSLREGRPMSGERQESRHRRDLGANEPKDTTVRNVFTLDPSIGAIAEVSCSIVHADLWNVSYPGPARCIRLIFSNL